MKATLLKSPYYISLAEDIINNITYGMYRNGILPSERELCEKYKVSRITVRKAFEILRERGICETARGRRHKIIKRYMSRVYSNSLHTKDARSREIMLITISAQPCYQIVNNTINMLCKEKGVSVLSFFADRNDSSLEEYLFSKGIDGIICTGIILPEIIGKINRDDIPVIHIGFYHPKLSRSVVSDNFKGGYIAGKHLFEHGHKRVAFLQINRTDPAFSDRERGFRMAAHEYGVNDISVYKIRQQYSFEGDKDKIIKSIIERHRKKDLTAIFAVTDLLLPGLIFALKRNNIVPGKNISLVGYDNMSNLPDWERGFIKDIDSVEEQWETIANCAFKWLYSLLKGEEKYTEKTSINISPELIVKGSVADCSF